MNVVQMQVRSQLAVAVALIALGAVSLAGCGVRGSLEAPSQAKDETVEATPGTPGEAKPHKPFPLDPILR